MTAVAHCRHRPLLVMALVALIVAVPTGGGAYQQIVVGSASLSWALSALPVSYVLQADGSDDVADSSEFLAVRLGFAVWEDIPDSAIAFEEDLGADATRTDWEALDIHMILFDEDDSSGFFGGSSGTVAVTPLSFNTITGAIIDADIIFNGDDNTFSTDLTVGTFDIQSVVTHEIGHFIGLDHAAVIAATMFPYADEEATTARSLCDDDVAGAAFIYPVAGALSAISGTVRRSSDSAVIPGAHVVAVDANGIVIASVFSAVDGTFAVRKLPAGSYTLFAEPLDEPVTNLNIGLPAVSLDFSTTFHGGNPTPTVVALAPSTTVAIGDLLVGDAALPNLTVSGASPYLGIRGTSRLILVLGENIDAADDVSWSGSGITKNAQTYLNMGGLQGFVVTVTIDAGAALGPRNVHLDAATGELAVLTGALEISNWDPWVDDVDPASGTSLGGDIVTVTGFDFVSGAIVIFGDELATSVTFVSDLELTVTTPPHDAGVVTVFVQNPDGQLGALGSAYTFEALPVVTAIFPEAGAAAGGTQVVIGGTGFVAGLDVTFDGVPATVLSSTPTSITCTVPAGVSGAADIEITNPGGGDTTAAGAFTYLATPDPTLSLVLPVTGTTDGGTEITIAGTGFDPAATVTIDLSLLGSGGVALTSVVVVDPTEITAEMPAHASGTFDLVVVNPSGAAARLTGAFTYTVPPSPGGGGGGGCLSMGPPSRRLPPGDMFGGILPYAVLALLLWRIRSQRPARDPALIPVSRSR